MTEPPLTRHEFEEKNRKLLSGERAMPDWELFVWQRGRDWLVSRFHGEQKPARRASPRVRVELTAHVAGVGRATTEDVGFSGFALRGAKLPRMAPGQEASVRLGLGGRSIYALGKVAWATDDRVGISIEAIHPADQRSLQAFVCGGLLDRFSR